ncbi:MAG: M48 family metalloprotease [Pyrinomonadaceae bacterium]
MKRPGNRRAVKLVALQMVLALVILPLTAFAQTQIKLHSNKFSPAEDVRLGRQAAAEAEQQFPLLRDSEVNSYAERVGQRLVASIPTEFQHPEFRYYFRVINASDINAFALPGGPMYVNRGMIETARTEGEMAGVMAHELSHVALRHGTAQATKAQKYSVLAGILGIGGAILGGPAGAAAQIGAQGVGVYFLKFSREYETEADLLGARIMANAGYDPRDLANVFRTLEQQGGGGGGFLSDHPSPANRYARINQEAQSLRINTAARTDSREFLGIRERLRSYPRAQTMAEIQRSGRRYPNQGGPQYPNGDRADYPSLPRGQVEYPSSRYRTYNGGSFTVSIPENWREINQQNSLWFAPNGAYGSSANGQNVFTHAVNFGIAPTRYRNLQQATDDFINSLQQGNRSLRARSGYQRMDVDGRLGQLITFDNVNEATGRAEIVNVVTTQLRNGQLFYMIAVSPSDEYRTYQNTFLTIARSLRLND